jgi:hypothetical protein
MYTCILCDFFVVVSFIVDQATGERNNWHRSRRRFGEQSESGHHIQTIQSMHGEHEFSLDFWVRCIMLIIVRPCFGRLFLLYGRNGLPASSITLEEVCHKYRWFISMQ